MIDRPLYDKLDDLRTISIQLDCLHLTLPVLNDPRFSDWSGSPSPDKHHYGDGGLLIHTHEVTNLCLANANQLNKLQPVAINTKELIISAIWHDYGKIWDYVEVDGVWGSAPHKRNIYHITRSGIEWMKIADKFDLDTEQADRILHNILAHHGRREWGSPVAPNSREAWILHLCDNMSARVCDVETLKLV